MSPVEEDYDQLLLAALEDLAEGCATADDVARKLADAGCRGPRAEPCDCPVWVWLSRRVGAPDDAWIKVSRYRVRVMRVHHRVVGQANLPAVIHEFIKQFDELERFPELEAGPAPQAV